MNTATKLAPLCALILAALPLAGCEGESPSKAIPRTEAMLDGYALTQVYSAATVTGEPLDAASLKSQIDPLVDQYGQEQVVEKIKEIAAEYNSPAVRAAAVFSIQPYVDANTYNGMIDALDEDARASFDELTQ